jgi:hypothetical protein
MSAATELIKTLQICPYCILGIVTLRGATASTPNREKSYSDTLWYACENSACGRASKTFQYQVFEGVIIERQPAFHEFYEAARAEGFGHLELREDQLSFIEFAQRFPEPKGSNSAAENLDMATRVLSERDRMIQAGLEEIREEKIPVLITPSIKIRFEDFPKPKGEEWPARTMFEDPESFRSWLGVAGREVWDEAFRGPAKFGPLASLHEGYGVLAEELEELFAEIKNDKARAEMEDPPNISRECVQIAAVALRMAAACMRLEAQGK